MRWVRVGALLLALAAAALPASPAQADASPDPLESIAVASTLTMSVPAPVTDGDEVSVSAGWTRTSDDAPLSGVVELDFQRRGLSTWTTYTTIPVTDGVGSVRIRPRDDGAFRLHRDADDTYAATDSSSAPLTVVPTKPLTLRPASWNLPGPDKLAKAHDRARTAAGRIDAADVDVVVFNEMVGPDVTATGSTPSTFAALVLKDLGSAWRLVTPTRSLNENYIAYRPSRVSLIAQYDDAIVPGTSGGAHTARHVTRALFKDVSSGRPFLTGVTQLVNDDRPGAAQQAVSAAQQSVDVSSGYPVVVAGDMNDDEELAGMTDQGLQDARRHAHSTSHASYSTYVNYSKARPEKTAFWIIDQVYVPSDWTVRAWRTDLPTKHGAFTRPRPSDHMLVVTSLMSPKN